jgi:hypothetical protein
VSTAGDRRKARAKYRRGRARRGVCLDCRKPASRGLRCDAHGGKVAARTKARYAGRRAAGLCVDCGVPSPDAAYCPACIARKKKSALRRKGLL